MTPSAVVPHHRRRTNALHTLDKAAELVVEALEGRVLLSTGGAWTRLLLSAGDHHGPASGPSLPPVLNSNPSVSPTDLVPSGIIRGASTAPSGFNVTQIRHLYGWDALSTPTPDPAFPLFTNSGDNEAICVVGAPTYGIPGPTNPIGETINDVPMVRMGDLTIFNTGEPVTSVIAGVTNGCLEENAEDLSLNNDPNFFGAIETTMLIEWAHAFAPAASLYAEYVNTNQNVIAPADLLIGIQAAIDTLEAIPETSPPPINAAPAGGVIVLSEASGAEIASNMAQFDAVFSQARAANISFVCAAGDVGGAVAMPGASPFVTTVGGTTYRIDGAGNRLTEAAWLSGGGGQSTTEPLPAFQQGIKLKNKLMTGGRAVPDLSVVGSSRNGGVDVAFDPTPTGNAPRKWYTFEGTSVGAAIIGGMFADANELRESLGMPLLGSAANAKMYSAYQQNPTFYFHDITGGNNTKHSATKGFDLATGMGTPNMDALIPALADVVATVNTGVHFNGFLTAPLGTGLTTLGVISYRGTGTTTISTQNVGLNLNILGNDGGTATLNIAQIDRALDNTISGTGTVTITSGTASFTLNVAITGKVSRLTSRKPKVNGNIFTIDPLTGQKLKQGSNAIFQGSFSN
jgi:subtilase family serine protease